MLDVTIVSANPETLDGLAQYFAAAGLRTRCARRLADCAQSKATTHAFVLFPDDFSIEDIVATIRRLAADRPSALPVVVTSEPKAFADLERTSRAVIVARPAWASAILDAVRAHAESAP
jgi:hypothetical protein